MWCVRLMKRTAYEFQSFRSCCFLGFFYCILVYFPTRVEESTVISFLQINSKWKQTCNALFLCVSVFCTLYFPLSPFQDLIRQCKKANKPPSIQCSSSRRAILKPRFPIPVVELSLTKVSSCHVGVILNLIPAQSHPLSLWHGSTWGPENL